MPDPHVMTLEDWIARGAFSFSLDSDERLNAAVDRLVAACDPSLRVLGLGEPTHLVNDYLRLRNRLFQALVERHGFSAIALESSFSRAAVVNEFVAGRTDSLDDALDRGITHGMGRMPANRELLEWMRRHNARASTPLRFYGFDSPTEMTHADSPRRLLSVALDYLATLDPTRDRSRRERIEPLIGSDADWENPAAMRDPGQSVGRSPRADALRVATEDLINELAAERPRGVSLDADRYRDALRHAEHARQMLAYHALGAESSPNRIADMLGWRDVMMADNLRYAAELEKGRGRLFAFAHNSHLKRGPAVWQWGPNRLAWWPAGAHLGESMGSKYAVIGVGVGTSTASKLAAPEADTLEGRLLTTPGPARLVATRPLTRSAKSFQAPDLPVRGTGGNPGFFPFGPESLTDFDFLAVLDAAE